MDQKSIMLIGGVRLYWQECLKSTELHGEGGKRKETSKQTNRHTDKETKKQRNKETKKQRYKDTKIQRYKETNKQINK